MSHLISRQPWGVLDVDTVADRVFFQQAWRHSGGASRLQYGLARSQNSDAHRLPHVL